jgi:hypothetical protein
MTRAAVSAGAWAIVAVVLLAATTGRVHADTPTPTPAPQVTSDIVVVMDDSYENGDIATISIRNDGDVAYRVWAQPACLPDFKDSTGRLFVVVAHCDIAGYSPDPLDPGETVVLLSAWYLRECIEPGFSCFAVRPLATGDYTVFGSLDSVDGLYRAEFSKTVHITGPQFTSDVKLDFLVVVTDPPVPGDTFPVTIELRNTGQREYRYALTPGCYLRFYRPDGYRFTATGAIPCDTTNEDTISPGETVRAVAGWNRDECTEFGQASTCLKAAALAPGTYTVKGDLWSADKQAYAEFSNTLVIQPAQAPPSPSPWTKVYKDFPITGGPPDGGSTSASSAAATVALGLFFVGLGSVALRFRARSGQRRF